MFGIAEHAGDRRAEIGKISVAVTGVEKMIFTESLDQSPVLLFVVA